MVAISAESGKQAGKTSNSTAHDVQVAKEFLKFLRIGGDNAVPKLVEKTNRIEPLMVELRGAENPEILATVVRDMYFTKLTTGKIGKSQSVAISVEDSKLADKCADVLCGPN
jgi:hypothetical protein